MLRLVARYLGSTFSPRSRVALGKLLVEAGEAALLRQQRIEGALTAVRTAVGSLTEK